MQPACKRSIIECMIVIAHGNCQRIWSCKKLQLTTHVYRPFGYSALSHPGHRCTHAGSPGMMPESTY